MSLGQSFHHQVIQHQLGRFDLRRTRTQTSFQLPYIKAFDYKFARLRFYFLIQWFIPIFVC